MRKNYAELESRTAAPKELSKLLKYTFPEIKLKVPDGKGGMMYNYQIFRVRNVEDSNTPSAHSFGRALDIYLDAFDISERMIADYLFQVFIKDADDLGITSAIWNWQIWEKSTGKIRKYEKANKHTNHIHIQWSENGSQKVIFGSIPARLMMRIGFPSKSEYLPDPILENANRRFA